MDNPYQTGDYRSSYPTSTGYISPGVMQALAGTKPWVRLCSVMGFIAAGFMILAGLTMIVGGAVGGMSRSSVRELGWVQSVVGAVYLVLSLIYVFPSMKLWKYGTAILRLMSSQSASDLQQALEEQRGFWKFVGILMLVFMAITLLAFGVGIISAIATASR